MNRPTLALSLSLLAFLGLAGCSSESQLHMREARAALRAVEELSRSRDGANARVMAIRMRDEVRAGLATAGTSDLAKSDAFARFLSDWEAGSYQSLETALAESNGPGTVAALAAVKAQCTSCHVYAGRPGIGL